MNFTDTRFQHAFNYDNISLAPRVASTLMHRTEAKPSMQLGGVELRVPILGSPMADVCGVEMCVALGQLGAMGILHRFWSIDAEVTALGEVLQAPGVEGRVGAAVGITDNWRERFAALHQHGCRIFCLDTANGAHEQVSEALHWIRNNADDVFLITGNVATKEAFAWLQGAGADAIRVSIAGGGVCETKNETGVYVPTPYAVWEVAEAQNRAMIVGDGGVRLPADFCKLLALGADVVMLGSALAGTKEAPGAVLKEGGNLYKIMRGSASFSVQQSAGNVAPEYVEGDETFVRYKGKVADVIGRYLNGLRSSMSYMNAHNLTEYRNNCSFIIH